jgi:N-acyl-D-aspartate/D-glutamate deacylase
MTYDLKIKGATVIDGSGKPGFAADVAVKGGIIVAIGALDENASREIDANGALLTPGFIDIHTHYDGQALWDDALETSTRHGVTTAFMGNCGVGFAPLRPEMQETIINLMSGVEDIPGDVLRAGLRWNWTTFADYLDRLEEVERPIDIGTQVPHDAVRLHAMGERAVRQEQATPDDIAEMQNILRESLLAGAFGFSFGRVFGHRMSDGNTTPSYFADHAELEALASVMRDLPYRVLQGITDGRVTDGPDAFEAEFNGVKRMMDAADRPMSFNLQQRNEPEHQNVWQTLLAKSDEADRRGQSFRFQVGGSGSGSLLGFTSSLNPFSPMPSYREIHHLPLKDRIAKMRDGAFRSRILTEAPVILPNDDSNLRAMHKMLSGLDTNAPFIFPLEGTPDLEPGFEQSIAGLAAATGKPAFEILYDHALKNDGEALFAYTRFNYIAGDLSVIHQMLTHPNTMFGVADAGAHLGYVCENAFTTRALTFWSRDRSRGPKIPVHQIVNMLTGKIADHLRLEDRGRIAVGLKADLNIIDYDNLSFEHPYAVSDLPAGGKRFLQRSDGYLAVIKDGVPIVENDTPTEAKPGKLIRAVA